MDSPATRTPMINTLRSYEDIRRNCQFWFFSYPSGYRYAGSHKPFCEGNQHYPDRLLGRYHWIMVDRGRGDTPNSSDGVVPYWSSHLERAQSEIIVPSNHSSHQNPKTIQEARRILPLHTQPDQSL
ncbi:MAG TPA: hypothetical protein VIT23_04075 [Terrimicrobiaceae bacterium]